MVSSSISQLSPARLLPASLSCRSGACRAWQAEPLLPRPRPKKFGRLALHPAEPAVFKVLPDFLLLRSAAQLSGFPLEGICPPRSENERPREVLTHRLSSPALLHKQQHQGETQRTSLYQALWLVLPCCCKCKDCLPQQLAARAMQTNIHGLLQ